MGWKDSLSWRIHLKHDFLFLVIPKTTMPTLIIINFKSENVRLPYTVEDYWKGAIINTKNKYGIFKSKIREIWLQKHNFTKLSRLREEPFIALINQE
jgi:hypothetical protein